MGKRRLYSEEEDDFIRQHYTSTPHRDIADKLGRTVKSIRKRAYKIGCDLSKPLRRWTQEEDKIILSSRGRTLVDVAEELGRDPSAVLKRAKKLGWHSWRRPDGGPYIDTRGYVVLRFENGKPIYEHRAVVETVIGRCIATDERVHHIDLDKRNNKPENLILFPGPREHRLCHNSLDAITAEQSKVPELLRMGKIYFDRNEGVYKCDRKI